MRSLRRRPDRLPLALKRAAREFRWSQGLCRECPRRESSFSRAPAAAPSLAPEQETRARSLQSASRKACARSKQLGPQAPTPGDNRWRSVADDHQEFHQGRDRAAQLLNLFRTRTIRFFPETEIVVAADRWLYVSLPG